MAAKIQCGRHTCHKKCLSRYVVDIKSKEIFQVVSVQNREYEQNCI